jgi:D-alanyl-D-alanine-carboxypeptidase/D-alanyl-D-alanine-endopeptidase
MMIFKADSPVARHDCSRADAAAAVMRLRAARHAAGIPVVNRLRRRAFAMETVEDVPPVHPLRSCFARSPRSAASNRSPRTAATVIATLLLAQIAACGGGGSIAPASPTPPAPAPDAFAEVDRLAAAAFATAGIPGMSVAVYDRDDRRVFVKNYGDFAPDRRVAVASASKLVTGTVLLRLVDQGFLSLDSTTGAVLGWTGPKAAITLRHLLSFTSGLPPSAACTSVAGATLAECVAQIASSAPVAAPGTRYDYGSTHLHVAARMAEVVTGTTWDRVFDAQLRQPLRLPAGVAYYTLPRQTIGTTNPLVAGGLRASIDEYARLLSVTFHRGTFEGQRLAAEALFDAQAREPYPGVVVGTSPIAQLGLPYRYGLAAWLECTTPATGCATLSSPGAFGWTPWVDRDAGYYAIIGMEISESASGVVAFSVDLAQRLKPEIRRALGR